MAARVRLASVGEAHRLGFNVAWQQCVLCHSGDQRRERAERHAAFQRASAAWMGPDMRIAKTMSRSILVLCLALYSQCSAVALGIVAQSKDACRIIFSIKVLLQHCSHHFFGPIQNLLLLVAWELLLVSLHIFKSSIHSI